jgi:urease accessory protein
MTATVGDGALLAVLPDPLTCFADAVYAQRQTFNLAAGASLILLDWITCGRSARGERWAFTRCELANEVFTGGKQILFDRLSLDPSDGPVAGAMRTGGFDCLATVVMLGPQCQPHAARLVEWVRSQPISPPDGLLFSASPLADGLILRMAGIRSEGIGRWLRDRLDFIPDLLGDDPWRRKY